jgi:hypothetical protein
MGLRWSVDWHRCEQCTDFVRKVPVIVRFSGAIRGYGGMPESRRRRPAPSDQGGSLRAFVCRLGGMHPKAEIRMTPLRHPHRAITQHEQNSAMQRCRAMLGAVSQPRDSSAGAAETLPLACRMRNPKGIARLCPRRGMQSERFPLPGHGDIPLVRVTRVNPGQDRYKLIAVDDERVVCRCSAAACVLQCHPDLCHEAALVRTQPIPWGASLASGSVKEIAHGNDSLTHAIVELDPRCVIGLWNERRIPKNEEHSRVPSPRWLSSGRELRSSRRQTYAGWSGA